MRFLIIDDCASRYDEFNRLLDRQKIKWVITCDPEFIEGIHPDHYDAILLDHDMPHRDGREWARWIVSEISDKKPIVITSTTGLIGVREEMLQTLKGAGFPAFMCPADHASCELEWLSLITGCLAGQGKLE